MTTETWKALAEFPSYEVSDQGSVRRNGRVKHPRIDRKGYHQVTLWANSKSHKRMVSRLVAEAFIGPRPAGQVVRHKDGIKAHNHASNLQYGTPTENEADKATHGTALRGERHHQAKLTAPQVQAIRTRYVRNSRTHGTNALAREFGVTGALVHAVVTRKLWKELP